MKPIRKWWQFWIKKPIWKMATIYKCYAKYGYPKFPRDEGKLIEVEMKSGKTGVYKLVGQESAWNVDWDWLLWELQGYLPPKGEQLDKQGG